MISKFTLVLAVASLAIAGCKKDKGPKPVEQAKKISRVEENGQTNASFQYNADGSVKSLTVDQGIPVTFTFTYNAQKKVSEVNTGDGMKSTFVYEGGILKLTENFEDGQKVSENNFVYENGRLKSNTLFTGFPEGNGTVYRPTYRRVFHYNANGNVQKVSIYALDDDEQLALESEFVYTQYDNKKNPLTAIADFSQAVLYEPISVNNPLTEKWQSPNGAVLETTQNEYTYDAAGYPVTLKATTTPQGGAATVRNVKFFY
jgi:hypothetical protein